MKVDLVLRLKDMEEEARSEQERIHTKTKKEKGMFERRISELEVHEYADAFFMSYSQLSRRSWRERRRQSLLLKPPSYHQDESLIHRPTKQNHIMFIPLDLRKQGYRVPTRCAKTSIFATDN